MTESSAPVRASDVEAAAPPKEPGNEERLAALKKIGVSKNSADLKMVPLELLREASKNPRRGAVSEVIESIREFGQHRPMVVQISTGEVIVGNHLLRALRSLGEEEGACFIVEDDDHKALRRGVADNAVGDKAGWDEEELAAVLREVGPTPGYDEGEVDALLRKLEPEDTNKTEPTYPLVPRLNERYDYVMIFCENETDWTWLQTRLELRSEKSYKSNAVAKSHVITVARLQELIGGA
jgi:hypothetical protein